MTFVTPEDVKSIGPDVLRHRIILTYEAEAQGVTSDDIIKKIFNTRAHSLIRLSRLA